jgi:hypothetical protein
MTIHTADARTADNRAEVRAEVADGALRRTPVSKVIIASALDIAPAALLALANSTEADAYNGRTVRDDVIARLCPDIGDDEGLGDALVRHGVLTETEAEWLADD